MFACLYVPDFPVQAALLPEPMAARPTLKSSPIVVLDGPANLLKVIDLNDSARRNGITIGMTKLQVETCGGVLLRKRSVELEDAAQSELIECASGFSPRVESTCPGTVILDLEGTEKLFGPPERAAHMISARAGERGFDLRVGVASNPDTALHVARGFAGVTVIPSGMETHGLARLSVDLLPITPEMLEILESWGIRTFGALAALPATDLTERLGQPGLYLQKLAQARVKRTLVPVAEVLEFTASYEFDDPVETLESLCFVLNLLLQQVCHHLAAHTLATNELQLTLDLEVRQRREVHDNEARDGEQFQSVWKLPTAVQDARMLFTLMRLDLERNTFSAPIRKITIEAQPVKRRMAQGNLFAPPCPEPENLEITLARIRGIVGQACEDQSDEDQAEADSIPRVGSPAIVDTHKSDAFAVRHFSSAIVPASTTAFASSPKPLRVVYLRIFRPALETVVERAGDKPCSVRLWKKRYRVVDAFGPWFSSGNWWGAQRWAREEWDVTLKTSAGIGSYRIYRDGIRKRWFVEGIFD